MSIKIGIVGYGSVGKDTVARYLVDKYSFVHISSGDLIRKYMVDNNLGVLTREAMQKVANELREKFGASYLVEQALAHNYDRVVVSGLRAIPEAEYLKERGGIIVALSAPLEVRYAWALRRKRVGDIGSIEEFKLIQEKEALNPNKNNQNIQKVIEMADEHIVNDDTETALQSKIDAIMAKYL